MWIIWTKLLPSAACVKLYLCSNPADSVVERRALREVVFPKLREHCRHNLGVDFRVIDPHESIHRSHWPCEKTRKELIEECRESSAGPFLLALIGHEYGKASFPAQVEVPHFHLLLQQIQQMGLSTRELERVYSRDENTVPPTFCLRRPCVPQEETHMEDLVNVFATAVSLCVRKKLLTEGEGLAFSRSVLDSDLRFALDNRPRDDVIRRCLVYVHKITNLMVEQEARGMDCFEQFWEESDFWTTWTGEPGTDFMLSRPLRPPTTCSCITLVFRFRSVRVTSSWQRPFIYCCLAGSLGE
ncbi:NACHT and WD repeat domain-containing protein 2 [Syngnathus typhle]|uniref:NACHT and WD repeat domain-containing protein 2 n=1 Tax=Syngnathus typhle TaxID=161592 RepID=UPI002A69E688|nr:NACHT and WD repeat domain-containing protein 2 [Syngnathus typhle]